FKKAKYKPKRVQNLFRVIKNKPGKCLDFFRVNKIFQPDAHGKSFEPEPNPVRIPISPRCFYHEKTAGKEELLLLAILPPPYWKSRFAIHPKKKHLCRFLLFDLRNK